MKNAIFSGEGEAMELVSQVEVIDERLRRHTELDKELKQLKANIREVDRKKDELVAAAREKISDDEAKQLILERFKQLLVEQFDGYLRQYQRAFVAAIENLWDKYAVSSWEFEAQRQQTLKTLDGFMSRLGYLR